MAYVQIDGQQYPLAPGDNGVGSAPDACVRLPGGGVAEQCAVIVLTPDGSSVIRRVGGSSVTVNGVTLGVEPIPLIHGDKIEIVGRELIFGDDRKGGNTQFVAAVRMPEAGGPAPVAARSVAATGGRLVSLVDGREYIVPLDGLVLGRDPACDVVVPTGEVSRKHAVIAPGPDGYVLTDTSTNGVLVNGAPLSSPGTLRRGDVLKIGAEEFRFHADRAPAAAAPDAPGADSPAPPAEPALPVLATLEVTSTGLLHGTRFDLRLPLTHIGRGAHNDVALADESVSDSHAKLQRRDSGWYVVDMGSTNGTYVGGRRISGEALLEGAPDLRFGGVKVIFRAADLGGGAEGPGGRTRAIAAMPRTARDEAAAGASRPVSSPQRPAPRPVEPARRGVPLFWVVIAVLIVLAAILLLKGR